MWHDLECPVGHVVIISEYSLRYTTYEHVSGVGNLVGIF